MKVAVLAKLPFEAGLTLGPLSLKPIRQICRLTKPCRLLTSSHTVELPRLMAKLPIRLVSVGAGPLVGKS